MGSSADLPPALRGPFPQTGIYDKADWYDVDYAAYRAELPFYRSMLTLHAKGGVVVELGAGTGRLTLPLTKDGHHILAVEPSASMRALLQQKLRHENRDIPVEDAKADTFSARDVAVVMFPFNGLLHVTTPEELHRSFRHIHQSLQEGGCFCFDLTPPYWETMLRGEVGWGRVDERVHPVSGRKFLTCDRSSYDSSSKSVRIDIRYAYVDDGDGVEIALFQRMWTTTEIRQAVLDAGFTEEAVYGDVDMRAFSEGAPRLLMSARR